MVSERSSPEHSSPSRARSRSPCGPRSAERWRRCGDACEHATESHSSPLRSSSGRRSSTPCTPPWPASRGNRDRRAYERDRGCRRGAGARLTRQDRAPDRARGRSAGDLGVRLVQGVRRPRLGRGRRRRARAHRCRRDRPRRRVGAVGGCAGSADGGADPGPALYAAGCWRTSPRRR